MRFRVNRWSMCSEACVHSLTFLRITFVLVFPHSVLSFKPRHINELYVIKVCAKMVLSEGNRAEKD